jgi:hypothetical protein
VGLFERLKGWTMPKRWYAGVFVVFFILGASFTTWEEQRDKDRKMSSEIGTLKAEIDRRSPKISLVIESLTPGLRTLVLLASVKNLGSPSSIDSASWSLLVTTPKGTYQGSPAMIPPRNLTFCGKSSGEPFIIKFAPEDALYTRASTPDSAGGYVRGVLAFDRISIDENDWRNSATKIKLEAEDVHGDRLVDEQLASKFIGANTQVFIPELKYPAIIPVSTCPIAK